MSETGFCTVKLCGWQYCSVKKCNLRASASPPQSLQPALLSSQAGFTCPRRPLPLSPPYPHSLSQRLALFRLSLQTKPNFARQRPSTGSQINRAEPLPTHQWRRAVAFKTANQNASSGRQAPKVPGKAVWLCSCGRAGAETEKRRFDRVLFRLPVIFSFFPRVKMGIVTWAGVKAHTILA